MLEMQVFVNSSMFKFCSQIQTRYRSNITYPGPKTVRRAEVCNFCAEVEGTAVTHTCIPKLQKLEDPHSSDALGTLCPLWSFIRSPPGGPIPLRGFRYILFVQLSELLLACQTTVLLPPFLGEWISFLIGLRGYLARMWWALDMVCTRWTLVCVLSPQPHVKPTWRVSSFLYQHHGIYFVINNKSVWNECMDEWMPESYFEGLSIL